MIPDNISVDQSHQGVYFVYGVKSDEKKSLAYNLNIYAGKTLVQSKQFTLKKGQDLEEGMHIDLPAGTTFPVRISLQLNESEASNEVHFWVR